MLYYDKINLYIMRRLIAKKNVEPSTKSLVRSVIYNFKKQSYNRMMNILVRPHSLKRLVLWAGFLIGGILSVHAQDTLWVKGQILYGTNKPVADVSVAVEGSADLPVLTDDLGRFTVPVFTGREWLNISPSGNYKDKRVYINNRKNIIIYITHEEIASGEDILSVLSQNRLKRNIISSIAVLNTEEIIHTPAYSIDHFFQGRVPGMHVVNRSGHPASGSFVLMRGINSLNASNHPLYVVDGIPVTSMGVFNSNLDGFFYDPLIGVNVQDISKILIVKDPALAATYGSQASNGLVLIETLAPSATETVVDLDIRSGYSLSPSRLIPQLDAWQHKTLVSEVLFSSGRREEELVREEFPNLFPDKNITNPEGLIDYQHNTNWQDIIFRHAAFRNLNVNVRGGDEIARYGLSLGYTRADGIIKNTGYDGYNLRFVSLLNIYTWLRMNGGVALSYNSSQLKESAKVSQTNPILTALAKSPLLYYYQYDEEGNEITTVAPVKELDVSNPLAVIDNFEAHNNNFHVLTTIGAEASLNDNFSINTKIGITYNILKEQIFMPNQGMELYYNNEALNVAKFSNNALNSLYNNTYLMYNNAIGSDHHFTSNTGVNVLRNDYEFDLGLTRNAPENDFYRFLQDGTSNLREIRGNNRKWNWISIYENITYSFRDKYLASASFSIDGSSRIGDNALNTFKIGETPYGFFYGGGIGWRVSSEPFLKDVFWIEELKLKLTHGYSGNDDIGESTANNYYKSIKFRETVGLYPATIPNDELTYETVSQTNIGLDIALLASRLSATIDLYSSVTNDMLIYSPMEVYLGYDYRPENSGKMQNRGIDVGLYIRIIDRADFKWDLQAAWSGIQNEVLEIKGDMLVTSITGAEIANIPGEQANSFYGLVFKGVYSTTSEAENAGLVNNRRISYQAGDAIFEDFSGPDGVPDGVINDYDKVVIGSSLPEQFGGISNKFTYKRWALNTFVQIALGNEVFNYVRSQNESMKSYDNQSTSVLNRWQYEGHETLVPRALWNDPVGNSAFSSRWIEDGSYLRIKNVTLSYTVPEDFLTFRNAEFYMSANNLYTYTKYLGYDPEFGYSHSQLDQGIDYGLTPQTRQFIVGIKLGL